MPDHTSPGKPRPHPSRVPDGLLSGSAAVLRHLDACYGPSGMPPGTAVALALDEDSVLLGQGRVRDLCSGVSPLALREVLEDLLGELVRDPRGAATDAVVLVTVRPGPARALEADLAWWSALVAACRSRTLVPAELICRTGRKWHTLQAATSGSLGRPRVC